MLPGDEPTDEPASQDPFGPDGEDDSPMPQPSWLGALGQMVAALLVVVAIIALSIGAAAALRRLLP